MNRQWVNIDDEGAAYALLRRLAGQLPVTAIDTLWLFPTRRASGVESTVAVISAFDAENESRRRVGAVRWLVTRDRRGAATVEEEMYEYATAPADALQRVVDGVMRRLGDDTREPPRAVELAGDEGTWADLLRDLGAPPEQPGESDAAEEAEAEEDGAPTDQEAPGHTSPATDASAPENDAEDVAEATPSSSI